MRTYDELMTKRTLLDRYRYLRIGGAVGQQTFGTERSLNQRFYNSEEWKRVRQLVLLRDNGCDLGVPGLEIYERPLVHHIVPLLPKHFQNGSDLLLDPNNLITVSHNTHNAIHYGDESLLDMGVVERRPNDTIPWRKSQ